MAEASRSSMNIDRVHRMTFSSVYPLYIQKAERKGRTKDEVDAVIFWLTGYDATSLRKQIDKESGFEAFFAEAPVINPDAGKITGTVCGVRVEEVEDPVLRNVRRLDKLVDELAKGKPLGKILSR